MQKESWMSLQAIKDMILALSHEERKELLDLLMDTFVESRQSVTSREKAQLARITRPRKGYLAGDDAQDYIDQQRDEWDRRA
jgi:hypothetical protein